MSSIYPQRVGPFTVVLIRRAIYQVNRAQPRTKLFGLVLLFGLVHVVYYLSGLRAVDLSSLSWGWIFADTWLLRERLAETLLYMHAQPPLYNLYMALVLRFPEAYQSLVFTMNNLLLGLGFYLSVYWLMTRMGVLPWLAFLLSTLFMMSPTFVLLEHSPQYDLLIAAMLSFSVILLIRFLDKPTYLRGFLFFSVLTVLCATRSLFHISYLVAAALLLAIRHRRHLRVILLSSIPCLLLIFSIYVKNYVLFDTFTASSWMGMNAAKVLNRSASLEERLQWVKDGEVSELMAIDPWSVLDAYPEQFRTTDQYKEIPLLSEKMKRTGHKNLHHIAYIRIANQYLRDVISIAVKRPIRYIKALMEAWYCYFRATDESIFISREQFIGWVDVYDYLFYGKSPWPITFKTDRKSEYNLYVVLLIGLPLLFFYGVRLCLRGSQLSPETQTVVLLMLLNIAFVALTINFFELAENQRARFYTDSFSLILLGYFIQKHVHKRDYTSLQFVDKGKNQYLPKNEDWQGRGQKT
jgi:hypothetical protein